MLPKEIIKLVEEIFDLSGGQRKKDLVREDVEAALFSLLIEIKKDLPDRSSMLSFTVGSGTYTANVEESRMLLDQNAQAERPEALAKSQ